MPNTDLELKPVDFLTVGTVGPRGKRVFHLQGAKGDQLITLTLEKVQVRALAEAINELLGELDERHPSPESEAPIELSEWDMELREPIISEFRVAQIGLGYDDASDMIVLVTQELVAAEEESAESVQPSTARFWGSRSLMRALAMYAEKVVAKGRPDPQHNGRIHYYWI